jgi:16S rRNA (guanine527-N7)-methyltransferase
MPEADPEDILRKHLPLLGVPADPAVVATLAGFVALLEKWNRAYNLTGTRDAADLVTRHILDSLSLRPFLQGISVLDVGTGAGLPGLPLAMVEPQRHFTLLDSGGKKIRFVRHVVGQLALANVTAEQCRVESYAPPDAFDSVVCRAFTSLESFCRGSGRLVAAGGRLLAMKGRLEPSETAALPSGWRITSAEPVEVPGLDGQRHIVVLERG